MKAMVAVDGSEGSWEAVRQAAAYLSPEQDELGLFYAVSDHAATRHRGSARRGFENARQALAEAVFAKAADFIPQPFLRSLHRAAGWHHHPREGIVLAAESWPADLIARAARHGPGDQRAVGQRFTLGGPSCDDAGAGRASPTKSYSG